MILAATARSAAIGSMLVLGACAERREVGREIVWETDRVVPSRAAQAAAGTSGPPGLDADGCREYTQTIRIGDEEQQAFGRACLQQDGSWRLHPPPQAPATQTIPPPSARVVPVYPYPYPYYYAPPPFFGSAFFFSHKHKHHHHHHRQHHHGHRHGHRR